MWLCDPIVTTYPLASLRWRKLIRRLWPRLMRRVGRKLTGAPPDPARWTTPVSPVARRHIRAMLAFRPTPVAQPALLLRAREHPRIVLIPGVPEPRAWQLRSMSTGRETGGTGSSQDEKEQGVRRSERGCDVADSIIVRYDVDISSLERLRDEEDSDHCG